MSMIIRGFWMLMLVVWAGVGVAQESDPGEGYFQRGQFEEAVQHWEKSCSNIPGSWWVKDCSKIPVEQRIQLAVAHQNLGRLRPALGILQPILADSNLSVIGRAQVLMHLSSVYLDMSALNEQLLEELKEGVCSKKLLNEAAGDITTDRATALASMVMQEAKICLDQAEKSLHQVEGKEKSLLLANILNQKGNLLVAQKKNAEALSAYQESANLARDTDKVLAAKASVNYIQIMLTHLENCEQAVPKFEEVLPELRNLPDSHDKAFTLLGLAALFKPSKVDSSQKPEKPSCFLSNEKEKDGLQLKEQLRLSAIQEALKVAKKLEDKTAMAYAYSYLAQLYAEQKRYDDAIQLTRQAIFYAEDSAVFLVNSTAVAWSGQPGTYVQSYPKFQTEFISYPEQLFHWEWQLGKLLLNGQGKLEGSVQAYERAANHLKLVGNRCGSVSRPFVKMAEDFYYEFAELLYWYHEYKKSAGEKQDKLQKILEDLTDAIESFKTNQLQNYFYSDCSNDLIEKTERLRQASSSAAATEEIFAEKKFLSPPTTALSYPFVFANAVFKDMTSLLGVSHLLMPSFGSVMFSSGFRTTGTLKNHPKQESAGKKEKKEFKFDKEFFATHQNTAVLYLFVLDNSQKVFEDKVFKDKDIDTISSKGELRGKLLDEIRESVKNGRLVSVLKDYPLSLSTEEAKLLPGTSANSKELEEVVGKFRGNIESVPQQLQNNSFNLIQSLKELHPLAQKLYGWLIAPATPYLKDIDTLVLVPSSILHTLPFAALWDEGKKKEEKKYLIQKYALVVEPAGSKLTALSEEKPIDYYKNVNVLLGGFSREVSIPEGKFKSLNVEAELENLREVFGQGKVIPLVDGGKNGTDDKFTVSNLVSNLENKVGTYRIIHLTTHGSFKQDSKRSFLLTYPETDQQQTTLLKMDKFREMFGKGKQLNVELLSLSACQSAIGDKDAALGFAGVAVGASRGAVGTLWEVNEFATRALMKKFYELLTGKFEQPEEVNRKMDKAKVLQEAQKSFITGKTNPLPNSSNPEMFKHPYFWAAFLLTGDWL